VGGEPEPSSSSPSQDWWLTGETAMSFVSFEFVLFFVAVILLRCSFRNFSAEKWFLLGASYAFVASWSVTSALWLLLTSIVAYLVGLGLSKVDDARRRRFLLGVGVTANLGILVFFKYVGFLLDNVRWMFASVGMRVDWLRYGIDLPAGISFFTFIAMTYIVDVYRRNVQACRNPRDALLFIGYFPQILSGPVNRAAAMLPQFRQRMRATAFDVESGLVQFGLGVVKKLVISDQIAPHVNMIFAVPGNYDGFTLLQGLIGYTIQIYCDFSGYSDMAIGCARIMGFRFMDNFQMPYSAINISEFWRRWHISLSTWFRDYLYIPLGGNRNGSVRTYMNLMLTMLLCGLWHGASWNFVFWGALHGAALAAHRAWKNHISWPAVEDSPVLRWLAKIFSRVLTLGVVMVGWLFFRADSWANAFHYLRRLLVWSDGSRMVSPYILSALIAMVLVHVVVDKDRDWALEIPKLSMPARIFSYASMLLLIVCLGASDSAPFIYFQF
jgi:alginate O-acetyltransferase complex protein AlgI